VTLKQQEQLKKLSTPALKADLTRARDEWKRVQDIAWKQESLVFDLFSELRHRGVTGISGAKPK
jgi:hypothetical protein